MTFSYEDPTGRVRDGMRLLCGDTRGSQALLQDEEYDFIRMQWPFEESIYMLASYAAETIAGKFAREIDFSADSQTVSANVLQEKYTTLALTLRQRARSAFPGTLYIGGLEPNYVPDGLVTSPSFGTQMHDNPEAGQQDFGDRAGFTDDPLDPTR